MIFMKVTAREKKIILVQRRREFYKQRNFCILNARDNGETLEDIAMWNNLSIGWVRTIINGFKQ